MAVSPPVALFPRDGAELRLCWGDVVVPVVPAALTAGAFACIRVTVEPAVRRPAYIDHAADEVVHVLAGSFVLTTGDDDPLPLEEGAVAFVPRGRLRRLDVVGGSAGTVLIMVTPGDTLDELLTVSRRLPPPDDGGSILDTQALALCGIEIVAD